MKSANKMILELSFQSHNGQIVLKTNESGNAVGAPLFKLSENVVASCFDDVSKLDFCYRSKIKLITPYWHRLSTAEANYLANELEFFSVVKAL
jgi:hypothetical protein